MSTQSGLGNLSKMKELWSRLLFVVGALAVYRIGTFIPVPGVNSDAMMKLIEGQQGIVQMFNMFSGGALERFSLFALNVMPYISASIIIQLCTQVFPSLQALKKEGESGRRKITQWTRYGTVLLGVFQSGGIAYGLQQQPGVVYAPGFSFVFTAIIALTAGTVFLMWLGEQVTEKGVGNGISLIITAGIIAGLPGAIINTLQSVANGEMSVPLLVLIVVIVLAVILFVVLMERAQRRITVNYARRQGGRNAYQNKSSHLPLKINMSGVIPPIFASSLIMFPATAGGFVENNLFLQKLTQMLSPGEPLYMFLYGFMILGFTFFYTALVFNAEETADNLKRSGALIPGIRPGKATASYIDGVLTRLTMWGSLYLVAVCLLPDFIRMFWSVPFYFGGTSLLIVVVVVIDFVEQVQAHVVSHQYDGLMKKASLRPQGGR